MLVTHRVCSDDARIRVGGTEIYVMGWLKSDRIAGAEAADAYAPNQRNVEKPANLIESLRSVVHLVNAAHCICQLLPAHTFLESRVSF